MLKSTVCMVVLVEPEGRCLTDTGYGFSNEFLSVALSILDEELGSSMISLPRSSSNRRFLLLISSSAFVSVEINLATIVLVSMD